MPRKPKPLGFSLSELGVHDSLRPGAPAKGISDYDAVLARLPEEPWSSYHCKANPPAPTSESCGRLILAVKSANSDCMLDLSISLCPKSVTTVAIGDIVEDVYTEDLLRAADTIRKHLDKSLPDVPDPAPTPVSEYDIP